MFELSSALIRVVAGSRWHKDALPLYQSKVFFAYHSPVSVTSDVKGQPQVRLVRIGVSAI